MALKTYNPTTPSQRQLVWSTVGAVEGQAGQGADRRQDARPAAATTTAASPSRFRGGGHKQAYRIIDFKRRKFDVPATVERLEYDPNRTAFIALIKYAGRRAGLHPGAAAPGAPATRSSPARRST